jgi:hypothetical protein
MTRKDYQMIAEVLRLSKLATLTRQALAASFAMQLQKDNPRFKPSHFFKACGI